MTASDRTLLPSSRRLADRLGSCCRRLLLGGCSSLPTADAGATRAAQRRRRSRFRPTRLLGRIATESQPSPELSGFRLMPLGMFSLDARVAARAARAEVSLDVQYYRLRERRDRPLLHARAARRRAARRARAPAGRRPLHQRPGRLLPRLRGASRTSRCGSSIRSAARAAAAARRASSPSLLDFARLNHRMHNKLFIADGAMAVIGGRNIANEYFLRSMADELHRRGRVHGRPGRSARCRTCSTATGTARRSTRSKRSAKSRSRQEQLRAEVRRSDRAAEHTPAPPPLPPNDILGYGPIADDLDGGRLGLIWGDAYVFADHPDKPFEDQTNGELLETSVTYNVFEAIRQARSELVASSPYFVPGTRGMDVPAASCASAASRSPC